MYRAYFAEYPDLGITTIVEHTEAGPTIVTAPSGKTREMMDFWHKRGFEVYGFTSEWEARQDPDNPEREYKYRRWHAIEREPVA